ncbi:MAG: hypothetical protein Q3974_09010, partial [Rothia sp. (in: high G+C Gram-positive bacteria)]|nr:hypothetical protein [Rothia sp. (in: high G+C Gram-positive bacteria)]
MKNTTVFMDGSVYSPADPYATALLMSEEQIEWVGSDAGARSISDSSTEIYELEGSLLTPAFMVGGAYCEYEAEVETLARNARAAGYGGVTVFCTHDKALQFKSKVEAQGLQAFIYARIVNESDILHLDSTIHGIQLVSLSDQSAQLISAAVERRMKVSIDFSQMDDSTKLLSVIEEVPALVRAKAALRLDGVQTISELALKSLSELGISLGFISNAKSCGSCVREAIALGIPVFLGSNTSDASLNLGWELARDFVAQADTLQQISSRSAFNA